MDASHMGYAVELSSDACWDATLLHRLARLDRPVQPTLGKAVEGGSADDVATAWVMKQLQSRGAKAWVDSLDRPRALLCHHDKPWDTDVLGIAVGAVACFLVDATSLDVALSPAEAYVSWATGAGYELLSARLDPGQIAAIQALESAGFRFVEVYVTLERDLAQHRPQEVALEIVSARAEDAEQIGHIAAQSFVYDRLHADSRIDNRLADAFKRAWAVNSCQGYADKVLVAKVGGQIAGFATWRKKERLVEGDKTALFDLMGVSERFRGQGIGKALVEAGCRWAQGEGLDLVEVGTQGTNSRVLGMYQKLGFLVVGTQVTLHWLRDR